MRVLTQIFIGLCILLTISGTAHSLSGDITLDSVAGLWGTSTDTIVAGEPITFFLRYIGDVTNDYTTISNAFRIYSPTGAGWNTTVGDTTGVLGSADFNLLFDIFEYGVTGIGADTILFVGLAFSTSGLPAGFNDIPFTLEVGPIDSAEHGETICLDSTSWPGAGLWKWTDEYYTDYFPPFDGPHCFTVVEPSYLMPEIEPNPLYGSHYGFDDYDAYFYLKNPGGVGVYYAIAESMPSSFYSLSSDTGYIPPSDSVELFINYNPLMCPQVNGVYTYWLPVRFHGASLTEDTLLFVDSVVNVGSVSVNITNPEEYDRKHANNPSQGWISYSSYSTYYCDADVNGWWSSNQGATWNAVSYNVDEYTFMMMYPDTTMLDFWIKFEIEDYGFFDADTVKNITVYQPDGVSPSVSLTYPNASETFASGDTITVTWSSSDNMLISMDSVFYGFGASPTFQYVDFHYGQRGSCWFIIPSIETDSLRVRVVVYDAAGNMASDISSNYSSIVDNAVTLTRPYPKEPVFVGQSYPIRWTKLPDVATVDIDLSLNGGGSWTSVAVDRTGTEFDWWVTADTSSNASLNVYRSPDKHAPAGDRDIVGFPLESEPFRPPDTPIATPDTDPLGGSSGDYPDTMKTLAETTDLAVFYGSGGVDIYYGESGGGLNPMPSRVITRDSGLVDMVSFDVNRDGGDDIVLANGLTREVSVHLAEGDGDFTALPGHVIPTEGHPITVRWGHFNADGEPDLWIATRLPHRLLVLFGNGDGTFSASKDWMDLPYGPSAGVSADISGNGHQDIAVACGTAGVVIVFEGDGSGGFSQWYETAVSGTVSEIIAADFDQDTRSDLGLVCDDMSGLFRTLINDGGRGFDTASFPLASTNHSSVVAMDVTGDGCVDIMALSRAGDEMIVLPGIPRRDDTTWYGFGHPFSESVGSYPADLVCGDFDLDGQPDVLVLNSGSGDCWLMGGEIPPGEDIHVEVISPNGGETWQGDDQHAIIWSRGENVAAVDVEVSRDSGNTWVTVASNIVDTTYLWTVCGPSSSTAMVRVLDPSVPSRADISDTHFTIDASCCVVRGDVDHEGGMSPIDIGDLVYLVYYMFTGGPEPPCWDEGDIDGNGVDPIDITDLVYLVNFMFQGGPEPPPCP